MNTSATKMIRNSSEKGSRSVVGLCQNNIVVPRASLTPSFTPSLRLLHALAKLDLKTCRSYLTARLHAQAKGSNLFLWLTESFSSSQPHEPFRGARVDRCQCGACHDFSAFTRFALHEIRALGTGPNDPLVLLYVESPHLVSEVKEVERHGR